jgi:biotin-dependent carboxylase-like uncharacterized protein
MIEVLKTGFYDSIQDLGRFGYQQYGIPYSGVMDISAALLANTLIGNDSDDALMEITMTGPTLRFCCNTSICLTGADISPNLNETPIHLNALIAVSQNDILSFGRLRYGMRSYLAVLGGFKSETVYGSKSMYKGITEQFRIAKNDMLAIADSNKVSNKKHAKIKAMSSYIESNIIKVYKGPEFDNLSNMTIDYLFSKSFKISKDSNRMAYLLDEKIENNLNAVLTSLVMPGTIQLTPDGQLIILMRDCQTTGGYPRILQLAEKSIDIIAQKQLGEFIQFKLINY